MKTLKNIIKRCEVCQKTNPKTEKLAKSGLQQSGKYPGEDWEIDFTHMPKANAYSCLQFWVNTFTGWSEVFPCCTEQAKEVIKILIHEIIPRFGLPRSLQSDNGSAFKAAVTQGVSKALGPWRRKWQPTPVFLSGESHGRRSLVGYSPRGRKESDTTEQLHFQSSRNRISFTLFLKTPIFREG